jgi:hypothetical protein
MSKARDDFYKWHETFKDCDFVVDVYVTELEAEKAKLLNLCRLIRDEVLDLQDVKLFEFQKVRIAKCKIKIDILLQKYEEG